MVAVGAGTLALPRLALHRETVLALTGGCPDVLAARTNGAKCGTKHKSCDTCPGDWQPDTYDCIW
jgi:hypothetical protein